MLVFLIAICFLRSVGVEHFCFTDVCQGIKIAGLIMFVPIIIKLFSYEQIKIKYLTKAI
jgi:Na+/proline symporter